LLPPHRFGLRKPIGEENSKLTRLEHSLLTAVVFLIGKGAEGYSATL
jgi:hypothetical protein